MKKSYPGHRSILSISLKRLRNFPADGGEARGNLWPLILVVAHSAPAGKVEWCCQLGWFGCSTEGEQWLAQSPQQLGEGPPFAGLPASRGVLVDMVDL